MAIKGFSEDVVQAMEFDPFQALGGDDGGVTDGRAPRARDTGTGRYTKAPPSQAIPAAPTVGRDVSPDGTGTQTRDTRVAPTAPVRPVETAAPQNSVSELMERVQSVPLASAVAATPPPQQPSAPQPRPRYDYSQPYSEQQINLPTELLQAIFHEDANVAAQGMNVLVNTMYNSMMQDIHNRIATILYNAPAYLENHSEMKMAQRALKDKFYGKFKELNTPQGQATVYSLAQNVAALYQNMGQSVDPMSDDFIDYVGNEAMKMLGLSRVAPRRTFQTGGGTREGGGTGGNPFMEAIGLA